MCYGGWRRVSLSLHSGAQQCRPCQCWCDVLCLLLCRTLNLPWLCQACALFCAMSICCVCFTGVEVLLLCCGA